MPARELAVRSSLRAMLITPGRGELAAACASVAHALAVGVRCIQIREPLLDARELLRWGAALRELAAPLGARLLVNSRVDLAAAPCFDGVHLSWRALPPREARALLGPEKWIGLSIHTLAEAADRALLAPCDYVLFGPVFATPSKAGRIEARGVDGLRAAARACPLPLVAVGGLDEDRVAELRGSGHAGCAAIRVFEDVVRAERFARAAAEVPA